MKIYQRYIMREHLFPFIFSLFVLLFVLLTNFLLRAIDRFLGKGLGIGILIEYVALNMAWIAALAVPMAVLVATLMAFGRLSHDNEITAIRTSGISYGQILMPAFYFGLVICLGLIYFNNAVLPNANHKARKLSGDINRKRPDMAIEVGYFIDDLPNYSMLVKGRDGEQFTDILIFSKDNRGFQRTIYADRGYLEAIDDAILLHLEDGEMHEVTLPNFTEYRRLKFERQRIVIPMDNLYLERRESSQRGDREMNVAQMLTKIDGYKEKISTVRRRMSNRIASQTPYILEGDTSRATVMGLANRWKQAIGDSAALSRTDSTRLMRRVKNLERGLNGDFNLVASYSKGVGRYWVEIHKKFALPVACIVFILVGAPVGIMARRGGFAVAGAMSLGFFVIYWALLIAGEELADRGLLSPFMAMWGANIILSLIGLVLILRMQYEQRIWRLDILDLMRRKEVAA